MGFKHRKVRKINVSTFVGAIGLVLLSINSAHAVNTYTRLTTLQWNQCRYELAQHGFSAQKQNDFCRLPNSNQWTCAQVVLKKYHSLELAKETCLSQRESEVTCYTQVLNRNFDPYVAKRVCKLK
ncbi:MAG: hypothetical protein JNM24_07620 [Bdellovibrionaceae bacterium]|nr:hypothetical protein [Pseudobdellovibrionaceae bacterium]